MIDETKEITLSELLRDSINSFRGEMTYYQIIGILQGIIYDLLSEEDGDDQDT